MYKDGEIIATKSQELPGKEYALGFQILETADPPMVAMGCVFAWNPAELIDRMDSRVAEMRGYGMSQQEKELAYHRARIDQLDI